VSTTTLKPARWTLTLERVKSFHPCAERYAALKQVLRKMNGGRDWPADKPFFCDEVAPHLMWWDLGFVLESIRYGDSGGEGAWGSTPEQEERVERAMDATSAAWDRTYEAWVRGAENGLSLSDALGDAQRAALMPYLRGEVV
jgi:hypothetical protein